MKTLPQAAKSLLKKLRKRHPTQVFLSVGFGQYRLYVYTDNQAILDKLPDTWSGYDISGSYTQAPTFLKDNSQQKETSS